MYETTVFRKPSDTGKCLNPQGECPDRYKRSDIRAYLHRAHKTCSSDHLLLQETLRIKQILINNGFTNTDVDREISKFQVKPISDEQNLKVFYEDQMSDACKVDECVLKNKISRNVTCTNQSKMELIIYYKKQENFKFCDEQQPRRSLLPRRSCSSPM